MQLLEENLTKHGHLNTQNQSYVVNGMITDIEKELEGFNLQSVFSLAKIRDDAADKKNYLDKKSSQPIDIFKDINSSATAV